MGENLVSTWKGRPIADLGREELIEVIEWCGAEIVRLEGDRRRTHPHVDWLAYLVDDKAKT